MQFAALSLNKPYLEIHTPTISPPPIHIAASVNYICTCILYTTAVVLFVPKVYKGYVGHCSV